MYNSGCPRCRSRLRIPTVSSRTRPAPDARSGIATRLNTNDGPDSPDISSCYSDVVVTLYLICGEPQAQFRGRGSRPSHRWPHSVQGVRIGLCPRQEASSGAHKVWNSIHRIILRNLGRSRRLIQPRAVEIGWSPMQLLISRKPPGILARLRVEIIVERFTEGVRVVSLEPDYLREHRKFGFLADFRFHPEEEYRGPPAHVS